MRRAEARSASPFELEFGFVRAVRRGPVVAVSGTGPIADDGTTFAPHQPHAQARRCFEIALAAVKTLGARPEDVYRTRMFVTDAAHGVAVGRAHAEVFGAHPPAATMVVAGLLREDWCVEIELEAWSPEPSER